MASLSDNASAAGSGGARPLRQVANNLWVVRYPLALLGIELGRTVSIIRLGSGDLVIHSTAPFTPADIRAIQALGRPAWLTDATLLHDTFAAAGRAAFPQAVYLAPEGFSDQPPPIGSLESAPPEWANELETLPLAGIPRARECLFFHRASRTLIVADLVFNFGAEASAWTRWFFKWVAGIQQPPGMSRLFRSIIRDRNAFAESIQRLFRWDFDRVIVGHGDVIESNAKPVLAAALARAGF